MNEEERWLRREIGEWWRKRGDGMVERKGWWRKRDDGGGGGAKNIDILTRP